MVLLPRFCYTDILHGIFPSAASFLKLAPKTKKLAKNESQRQNEVSAGTK
jgi:hypothetical protein